MATQTKRRLQMKKVSNDILRGAHIEALPDKILLKILSNLRKWNPGLSGYESPYFSIKFDLFNAGQVSKRWRRLANDESLWNKIKINSCAMPVQLIEKCLENGCEYLNLNDSHLINFESNLINVPTGIKLKYLRVGGNYDEWGTEFNHEPDEVKKERKNHDAMVHQLMKSSNLKSLEKLSYKKVLLDLDPFVFNNCKTMTDLRISTVKLELRDMKLICHNLLELSDLSLIDCSLENETITFLCQNLTSKIKKLSIALNKKDKRRKNQATDVTSDQIAALGQKCPNLEHFFLGGEKFNVSKTTLDSIIDNLKSLVSLRLPKYLGEYSELLRVGEMSNLKNLNVCHIQASRNEALLKTLKKDLPKLVIKKCWWGVPSEYTSVKSSSALWEIDCDTVDLPNFEQSKYMYFESLEQVEMIRSGMSPIEALAACLYR